MYNLVATCNQSSAVWQFHWKHYENFWRKGVSKSLPCNQNTLKKNISKIFLCFLKYKNRRTKKTDLNKTSIHSFFNSKFCDSTFIDPIWRKSEEKKLYFIFNVELWWRAVWIIHMILKITLVTHNNSWSSWWKIIYLLIFVNLLFITRFCS